MHSLSELEQQGDRDEMRFGEEELVGFLRMVKQVAAKTDMTRAEVIAAVHVLELRRGNDLAHDDGEARDDQALCLLRMMEVIAGRSR